VKYVANMLTTSTTIKDAFVCVISSPFQSIACLIPYQSAQC